MLSLRSIQTQGINLNQSRNALDFGRGFYTTTSRLQAVHRARRLHRNLPPTTQKTNGPYVLGFQVSRAALANLDHLAFVRGDSEYPDYWELVHWCRLSSADVANTHRHPNRIAPNDWYDVVCGPLAAVWPPKGRTALPDSDQFSFHTQKGIDLLNAVIAAGSPSFSISAV